MSHLRIVKRDEEHPSWNQGRNKWHNPQRDLDIVKVLALILGSTFGPLILLWVACEIVVRWPK